MNTKHIYYIWVFSFIFFSCASDDEGNVSTDNLDPCKNVVCEANQICREGTCIDDPNISKIPTFEPVTDNLLFDFRSGKWDGKATWTPSVVMYKDTLRMWYMGASSYPSPNTRIGYAWSIDGKSWQRLDEPVIEPLPDLGPGVGGPSVMVENDTLKMWYVANFPNFNSLKYRFATSTDGIRWELSTRTVAIPHHQWSQPVIVPGSVIREDGKYKMWYSGAVDSGHGEIGYAESTDGFSWVTRSSPVVNHGSFGAYDHEFANWPTVYKHEGKYHMHYWAEQVQGASPQDQTVAYATSDDGIVWDKYAFNPVLEPEGWAREDLHTGSALIFDNRIYIWYGAYAGGGLKMGYTSRSLE